MINQNSETMRRMSINENSLKRDRKQSEINMLEEKLEELHKKEKLTQAKLNNRMFQLA